MINPTRRQFLGATGSLALGSLISNHTGAAEVSADDPNSWAQFLGPRRDGVSRETGLNTDWTARPPKIVWKSAIGPGFSSVAIAEDRIYTGCKRGNRDGLVCLDARDGKEIWFHDTAASYLDKQRQGPGPRSTPTLHQGKLYCLFPMGELVCVNASDGKELWKTDVFKTTGAKNPVGGTYYWGMSGSPLVEGDVVIVQPGGAKNNSLAAFARETGKLVWAAGDDPPGYSSPIAITAAGRRQVISLTGQGVLAVDPTNGTVLYRYTIGNKFDCNCATPLWTGELVFVSAAYGTGCAALEIVATGDKLTVKEKWRNKDLQNQFATSVIHDGHIYGCHGDLGAKMLRCVELATGKVKWDDRRPGKCSLLGYEGHLVAVSENGTIRLLEANPNKFVSKGEVDGVLSYKSWPPPALLKGRLYVRDDKQLVCLDLRNG